MSRLTLHLQSCPSWVPQFIERSGVEWIKWIDPPADDPSWGIKVIGRTYEPDGESIERVWQGAAGARSWFDRWGPFYLSRTWVHAWEGPNEPHPMWDPQFRACLNGFTVELARLMHDNGLLLVGMNWSVGWPDIGTAPDLGEGVQACDYLGLHEYSAPAMWDTEGYHCLRYRKTVAELTQAGYNVPPILVTECGIDGGVAPLHQGGTGWRTYATFTEYLDQLAWYSRELDRDNVAAATIFTAGANQDWLDFDITEAEAMPLADWIAQDEPEPQPERARGIDVSQWQGAIDWPVCAESGIEFAFIRATVGDRVDPYWEQNYQGATDAGLLVGAYHYLEEDAEGQAGTFARAVEGKALPLGLWCDIEEDGLSAERCLKFLPPADTKTGVALGIYTRASFFDKYGSPDWAKGRLLWVADWRGLEAPVLPMAWDTWEFWQTTSDGAVPGVEGRVDLDVYAGTPEQLHSAYGNGEEPSMDVKVFDVTGAERDWAWLVANYGAVNIQQPDAESYYKVVAIREKHDDSTFIVKVLEADGTPKVGKTVLFYYDTAPAAPGSGWLEQGDGGVTNTNGDVGFGMGPGAYYYPPEGGPHKCWLFGDNVSEMFEGIGMLGGTNHNHIDITYQWVENGEEPEPEPEPEGDIAAQLARIGDILERIEQNGLVIRTA